MRVLISAAWLGGAGGAERALHSVLRALSEDQVDVVVRERLTGRYAEVGPHVRVFSLYHWKWRWANMRVGVKGALVQRVINPLRRSALPRYDVYLQFFSGADLNDTVRAGVRLLIPSGNPVLPEIAARYDAIAMQAPDNVRFVPDGARAVLLPPPVYDVAERSEAPDVALPDRFYLTVFNPYGGVKGTDDLAKVVAAAPHPFVWCHSQATVQHTIPEHLAQHPRIVHVEDATPEQLRFLYERCEGYVSVSRTEGFGWSIADALAHSGKVFARRIGVLTILRPAFYESRCEFSDTLDFNWNSRPSASDEPFTTDFLHLVSGEKFRSLLLDLGKASL